MLRGVTSVIKNAQKREMEAAVAAEKNSLLAGSILITSAGKVLTVGDQLVARFVHEVGECLESAMTTKVAAGLSRSLLLLPTIGNPSGRAPSPSESWISSMLLPKLLSFVVQPSDIDGTEEARATVATALTSFILALPDQEMKTSAAGIVAPALLRRAQDEGEKVWPDTSARLLELARKEPALFKGIIASMDAEQKAFVEDVLRKGGGVGMNANAANAKGDGREEAAPTIALKMDF